MFAQSPAQEEAKTVCVGCPVRLDRLAHALEHREQYGVWSAMTERERRALLRRRPAVRSGAEVFREARTSQDMGAVSTPRAAVGESARTPRGRGPRRRFCSPRRRPHATSDPAARGPPEPGSHAPRGRTRPEDARAPRTHAPRGPTYPLMNQTEAASPVLQQVRYFMELLPREDRTSLSPRRAASLTCTTCCRNPGCSSSPSTSSPSAT
ncbi:WhiB family transcriptional regulator [Streptomyces sp. NPDC059894]|uniref:WhiB family transcriptional regulator n=1 Tax=unclassified Streptomyces TaxID=2593676 RepID=UPI0036559AFC